MYPSRFRRPDACAAAAADADVSAADVSTKYPSLCPRRKKKNAFYHKPQGSGLPRESATDPWTDVFLA
eukprot:scaffold3902_cov140-Isochrysis_galbana.AAC.1